MKGIYQMISIKQTLFSVFMLTIASNNILTSSEPEKKIKRKLHVVYSHGFGQDGRIPQFAYSLGDSHSAPTYPDAPGRENVAVFYTKPAVHVLANHLYEKVEEGQDAIAIVGYSCGGGTADNCLAQLLNYDPEYFKDTKITSQAEADKIIAAINNGALIQTAPLLAVRKSTIVSEPSTYFANATFAIGTFLAWNYVSSALEGHVSQNNINMGTLLAGAATYSLCGDQLKKTYSSLIKHVAVPLVTNYHFDPNHPEPIDEVQRLRGKLSCPILLHFHKKDEVLENPDDDTIKVYDAFKGKRTHIILTDDGSHNRRSQQFMSELHKFNQKYFDDKDLNLKDTQPTIEELKKQIYPTDSLSIASRNKTTLLAASAVILNCTRRKSN